jgi:SAM-dependent methyltransferase
MTRREQAAFDARGYWERRLGANYALDGVGWLGLGPSLNKWMYRVRRHVFLREARRLFPAAGAPRVLDVGSGTGFYVDRWHELGVPSVTGCDLTDVAVERLSARFPQDRFVQLDVGGDEQPLASGAFDAISAFDVLFHIVDDERFARALSNLYDLLAPGGVLLFSDNFLRRAAVRSPHQASRTLAGISAAVTAAGFTIERRRPMLVLLNAPVDSSSPVLRAWWKALSIASSHSDTAGDVAGALVYPVELGLVSALRESPSTELMVCRKPAS